jgi:predicted phage terminase large subunit-like protein
VTPQRAAQELLRRRQARRSLEHFTNYTKPDYQVNWHHRVLCQYLDRFVAGEIRRLMLFMPPRHGKSELVSRRLPAYLLGHDPNAQIIACSYSADLASRMNRDVQRVMDADSYRAIFPDTRLFGKNVRTVGDGSWLRNSDIFEVVGAGGVYRSAGVGGGIVGMGFNYGLIDDPIKNRQEADSRAYRESLWEWYNSTFRTRAEKNASILLTLTRWHDDDLAGRLIRLAKSDPKADQWVVVRLPARADAEPSIPEDQRQPGEPLWRDKYDDEALDRIEAGLGSREWGAQFQQTPKPDSGKILDSTKLRMISPDEIPPLVKIVRYWDLAFSEQSGADYVSGGKVGLTADNRRVILHLKRIKGRWTESRPVIIETAQRDGVDVECIVEANGTQLGYFQDIHDDERMSRRVVSPGIPKGSKEMRASLWGSRLDDGIIYCVRGEWNQPLFDEMDFFPNGENDDQVDSVSGANYALVGDNEFEEIVYDEDLRVDVGY